MAVGAIITFIVQMRRLRHRGVEWSAHGHTASEWEHADLNPDRLAWKFTFLTKMLLNRVATLEFLNCLPLKSSNDASEEKDFPLHFILNLCKRFWYEKKKETVCLETLP